jgi:tetratricopeptide (TPR) repeat protein
MNKGALAVIFGLSLIAFRFSDVQAQIISKEPPEVVEVFDAMYRYNLPEAEKKFKKLYQTNLDPNLIDLTQANLFWWWLISGDNSRDYDHQMSVILHRIIDRLSQKPVDKMSEEEIFTMIHSYAYLTRVDIYLERYFTGMVNLKYDKYMLVSGLYNYFSAVTVAKYPVFAPFFALAPRSDRTKGFDLLNRCARMDNILIKNESLYYLMKINYQLEDDYKRSLDIANELIRRYPNNLIYHYHKFSILIEAGKKDEAREAYASLFKTSANAPGLNALQRNHLTDIARKRLLKEKINPAI